MRKFLLVLALSIFILSMLEAEERKVFKIGIVPWIAWNPLYVAEELGFWKEEGVEVEIINYANIREKINSFKNNITSISLGEPSDFFPLVEKGEDIKVLMCVDVSLGADKFFIRKGIKPEELKGKRIAISPYPAGDFFIQRGFRRLKIDPEKIEFVNVDSPSMAGEALSGGKVDGAYLYPPSSFKLEKSGIAVELFSSKEFPIYEAIFFRGELSKKEGDNLKKILKGWIKGAIWSSKKENTEKFLEIAKRRMYYRRDQFDYESWKKTMKEIKIFSDPSDIYRINKKGGEFWKYFLDIMEFLTNKNYIKKKIPPEDVIDQNIWKLAYRELFQ